MLQQQHDYSSKEIATFHAFSNYPQNYAHRSWLPSLAIHPRKGSQAYRYLAYYLKEQWHLQPVPLYVLKKPQFKPLFLNRTQARHLALLTGLALLRPQLIHVVQKDQLADLKTQVGASNWTYMMQKSPFLLGALRLEALPQVDLTDLKQSAIKVGAQVQVRWAAHEHLALAQRISLKFPKAFDLQSQTAPLNTPEYWLSFLNRLIAQEMAL